MARRSQSRFIDIAHDHGRISGLTPHRSPRMGKSTTRQPGFEPCQHWVLNEQHGHKGGLPLTAWGSSWATSWHYPPGRIQRNKSPPYSSGMLKCADPSRRSSHSVWSRGDATAAVIPVAAPDDIVLGERLLNRLSGVCHLVASRFPVDAAHRDSLRRRFGVYPIPAWFIARSQFCQKKDRRKVVSA